MACPVVAGDLALAESAWKMKHPGHRLPAPSYWKNLLASTATNLGYPALDQSSGLVNAAAAVREVLGQGRSFLASVSADPKNPSSWSARVAGRRQGDDDHRRQEHRCQDRARHAQADDLRHLQDDHPRAHHPDRSRLHRRRELHRAGRHRLRAGPGDVAIRILMSRSESAVYDSKRQLRVVRRDRRRLRSPLVRPDLPARTGFPAPGRGQGRALGDRHLPARRHGAERSPDRAPLDQLHAPGGRHVDRPLAQERHDQARSVGSGHGHRHRSAERGHLVQRHRRRQRLLDHDHPGRRARAGQGDARRRQLQRHDQGLDRRVLGR